MDINLLAVLPTPTCLIDPQSGNYVAVNPPFLVCLGYDNPVNLWELPRLFSHPPAPTNQPLEIEITTKNHQKKYLNLDINTITIVNHPYWLVTLHDISKYKQEIQRVQQEKQEISSQLLECSTSLEMVNELLESQVDKRQRITDSLRRNRKFMQRFIASSPCILYIYDLAINQYVYVNQESIQRLGYDVINDISLDRLLHPDDISILTNHYQQCRHLATHDTLVVEYRLRRADQSFSWYRSYDAVFEVVADQVVQIVGVAIDINDQKQAELALANSEQKNRAILGAIPDLILRLKADGTCLEVIPPPYPHSFLPIKENLKEILTPPILEKHLQFIKQAIATRKLQIYEQQVLKDNKLCDEEVYIVAVGEDEVLEIVRDISDRKIATLTQLELTKQNELMALQKRFFAMLSHEFRTPLSTILTSAQLLQSSHHAWLDEKARRNLKRIEVSVQDSLELLENIFTINRADVGALQEKKQLLDLRRFTEEVIESLTGDRTITTSYSASNDDYLGNIDPFLIRRILLNFLNNAIKYSPPTTEIKLSLLISLSQHQAIWQVIDAGIGILPAEIAEIFQAGRRGSNSNQVRGSGLGLAVAQACAVAVGGIITVNSRPEVGTSFCLIVPIAGC
jgi:signal transduction histidine kinase